MIQVHLLLPLPALLVFLETSGLAFEPGSGKAKGVFPLYYLRGLEAQLVAVGGSALDCCLLQDKVGPHLTLYFHEIYVTVAVAAAKPLAFTSCRTRWAK